jgi:hypothetical protein
VWWRSRRTEPPTSIELADPSPDTAELSRELLAANALRTQALAEQLLLTIEDAERHEEDPGRLDFLFEVDQLATRLRRESERQLLFADRVPAPMGPKPASLADVIRVAVGHCADYQRVQVAELPPEQIDNAIAEDLPHLLAELIDNGLALSPARTRVRVSGYELGGGGLLVQIDDEGIGMDKALFAELNAALRDPTEPGDLDRPHTGLRLVALIAYRHLLQVRLHPATPRGVSAQVMIPAASVYAARVAPPVEPDRAEPDRAQPDRAQPDRRETSPLLRPRFTPHSETAPGPAEQSPGRAPLPRRPAASARRDPRPPDPEPGDVERAVADVADFSEGWEGPWQG